MARAQYSISCPDGTQPTPLNGCEGTLTRVLRNAPEGSCNTDFTIWVANAGAASEVGNAILSGDFIADTLTVETDIVLPTGAIDTDDIAAGAVTGAKIATSAVTTAKIATSAVTNVKLAAKTILADKIADDTLTAAQIGANAIGTSELNNNAVTTAKITNDAVTSDKLAHSINIVHDLNVGRNVAVEGRISVSTVEGTGTRGRLTMYGLLYVDSGGTTHANSGFGGMGHQTYLHNGNDAVRRQNWASSKQLLSLYTEGAIQSRTYIGASDLRIKKDVRDIKDHEALQQIRQLDAKFYKYKDPIKRGYAEVLGFIAQDVNNTIPHAVYPKTDFIPNEMRVFDVQWKTDAETGHKRMVPAETLAPGRYKFIMFKGEEGVEEELTTKDGKTFLKDEDTPYTTDQKYDNVFLYGKEVDDFLTIDKNKIFAVAYAALQEVDRIQQVMQEKVVTLEETVLQLSERLSALEK